jgi:hypothetical protein
MTVESTSVEKQENIVQSAQKDNSAETNLRRLGQKLEEERTARMRLEEELSKERASNARKPSRDLDDDDQGDEPYVDRRALKKVLNQFATDFEQKVDKKAEEKASQMIERERQQTFLRSNPDFAQVLDPDNVRKFAERHPDIAEPMLEMPDNFARQKLLYQNIKLSGVLKPAVPEPSIQAKIEANRRSPYYQPSGGNTPPYESASDFSDSGQKNAYAKMQSLIKGRKAL